MSDVNPELTDERLPKLRDRVHALFGSRSDTLVRSVAQFLQRSPGTLDQHNLRIIATAAPHVQDPALIAGLIDRLPMTQMHVAAVPLDIESDRSRFGVLLPGYSVNTRLRLIADLVQRNTTETISFCPPERVTEVGARLIEDHLISLAKGDQNQQARALSSPFASSRVVDAVLDKIQNSIERSERGTSNREPGPLPLDLVLTALSSVADRETNAPTAEQVTRAWQLAQRCKGSVEELNSLLHHMTRSSKLEEVTAHSVIDTLNDLQDIPSEAVRRKLVHPTLSIYDRMFHQMLSVPELPLSAVRRVAPKVRESPGVDFSRRKDIVDRRWHFFRTTFDGSDGTISEEPTSSELDKWIARLPLDELEGVELLDMDVIPKMTDPDALRELGRRFFESGTFMFGEVCNNTRTPREMFTELLAAMIARGPSRATMSDPRTDDEMRLLEDHRLTDDDLVTFLELDHRRNRIDDDVLETVAEHPSSGPRVLHYVRDAVSDAHLLVEMARVSPNAEVHSLLAKIADSALLPESDQQTNSIDVDDARRIKQALADNGTVSSEIAGRQDVRASATAYSNDGLFTYGPRNVAARLIAEQREIGGAFVEAIIGEVDSHITRVREEAWDALDTLADAGLMSERDWENVTGIVDRHLAMRFATHPKCTTRSSELTTTAGSLLEMTARAVKVGVQLPEREPRSWSDLPDEKDEPFKLSSAAKSIDNQVVAGLTLEVPKTFRQLDELAEEMGNCLSFYRSSVASGAQIVAAARDDARRETYAVAWRADPRSSGRGATISQINSKHNKGQVPEAFEAGVRVLTDKLNSGELRPVVKETFVAERSSTGQEAGAESQSVRRRPARRRQPLELGADTARPRGDAAERQLGEAEMPPLLAPEVETTDPTTPGPGQDHADGQAHTTELDL